MWDYDPIPPFQQGLEAERVLTDEVLMQRTCGLAMTEISLRRQSESLDTTTRERSMSRSEPFPGGPSGPRDTGSLSNLRRDAAQLTTKTNATPARRSNSRAHHGPFAPGRGGAGALAITRWSVAASTTVRYGSSCGYLAEASRSVIPSRHAGVPLSSTCLLAACFADTQGEFPTQSEEKCI